MPFRKYANWSVPAAFFAPLLKNRLAVEFWMFFGRISAPTRAGSNLFLSFSPSVGMRFSQIAVEPERDAHFVGSWGPWALPRELSYFLLVLCFAGNVVVAFRRVFHFFRRAAAVWEWLAIAS